MIDTRLRDHIHKYKMQSTEFIPTFTLVMGGGGSGKNYYIEHNPLLSRLQLIDVDQVKQTMPLDAAIKAIKPMLETAFKSGESVVHPTTGSNLKGQLNKIALAKHYNYQVHLILVVTDPARAAKQVQQRVAAGGHDVAADAIAQSNQKARENFEELKQYADKFSVVTN